ncbi:MAG: hypothetical protein GF398_19130 [Chitinivibrionales bacterium]|nr:hypothetical protein [Chitinivibrionales bacterium]
MMSEHHQDVFAAGMRERYRMLKKQCNELRSMMMMKGMSTSQIDTKIQRLHTKINSDLQQLARLKSQGATGRIENTELSWIETRKLFRILCSSIRIS